MASIGFNAQGQFTVNGTPANYGQNYIINGGFDYWNYATSQTTSGYGSDDRWSNANIGSTKTHSLVNATDTERALFNSSKFSRTVVTSVAGVSNYVNKYQAIENVTKLAGKTVTISFFAKADSNKNIAFDIGQLFGTGGSPSSSVFSIGVQLIPVTSTWQKKTITVNIPSIVGKTLGTDGVHTSSTGIVFWFEAGSDWNARTASLGQQSGTFDIAEVKLEEGSVATPWTPYEGEFGGEIQACQRYFQRHLLRGALQATSTTTAIGCTVKIHVVMRALPILDVGTVSGYSIVGAGGSGYACTALTPSLNAASTVGVVAYSATIGTANLVAGNATILAQGSQVLTLDAEL